MNRDEHLKWAQARALKYTEANDSRNAISSMISDLGKHEELAGHPGILLGAMLGVSSVDLSPREVRRWIEGFS